MALAARLPARTVVELGTGMGISACYLAAGLELAPAGEDRRLVTLDARDLAERTRDLFGHAGLEPPECVTGRLPEALPPLLARTGALDLVFVDAAKGRAAMRETVDALVPHMSERGVIAVDDVRWNLEMRREWMALRSEDRWALTADLWRVGLLAPGQSAEGGISRP